MAGVGRQGFRTFIGNLPWTIGSTELRKFGSTFGNVQSAMVVFDRSTGLSKGYGFIVFSSRDAYNSALNASGINLEGSFVNFQPSTPNPQ